MMMEHTNRNIRKKIFSNPSCLSKFIVIIMGILVISSAVPNSFSISLVGAFFSAVWMYSRKNNENSFFHNQEKKFLIIIFSWVSLVIIAACFHSYLRYISPGYDLSWFAQAITNVKVGDSLRITSEREINLLVQHWEPILYTAVPLTYLFSGSISIVLWQGIALFGGTIAAWKISNFLFKDSHIGSLKYLTTILFVVSWINVNPIMFDAHPPVFGTLLIIPWVFYLILTNKNKYIIILLLLFLMQSGEMFLSIAPAYFVYFILKNKVSKFKILLSFCVYFSGFLLIGSYQRYFGPFITGDAFPFAQRYSEIGGDGIGILKTFFTNPLLVISQIMAIAKIKTILKIFLYCGPFAFLSIFSKKYRLISICVMMGSLPYFIQAGLSKRMETNEHYISSLGTQWWILTIIGIYYLVNEYNGKSFLLKIKNYIFSNQKIVPFFMILFFLNTSEWRKSLIYPFRGIIERDAPPQEVRHYLTSLPKNKGIMFAGAEWLCPLASDERKWLLCEGNPGVVLPIMPLDVVVANPQKLESTFNSLSQNIKDSSNGKILNALIHNQYESIGWEKIGSYMQYDSSIYSEDKIPFYYNIWKKK